MMKERKIVVQSVFLCLGTMQTYSLQNQFAYREWSPTLAACFVLRSLVSCHPRGSVLCVVNDRYKKSW
jgi:hypothetical protein